MNQIEINRRQALGLTITGPASSNRRRHRFPIIRAVLTGIGLIGLFFL